MEYKIVAVACTFVFRETTEEVQNAMDQDTANFANKITSLVAEGWDIVKVSFPAEHHFGYFALLKRWRKA